MGTYSAGHLSLREAIELTNAISGADSIVFSADLAGTTITLTGGELPITDDLTITGLGADQLTISANHASRIFHVDSVASDDRNVLIRGLSLEDGSSPAILTVAESTTMAVSFSTAARWPTTRQTWMAAGSETMAR